MKTVWITGGGSGIGRALAIKLADDGCKVFISGRDEQRLETVASGTIPIQCDITDIKSIEQVIEQTDTPDLAVLNAGAYTPGAVSDTSMDDFRYMMDVNYFGTLHCLKILIPAMQKRGAGHIAVVASLAGYRGLPNASGYGPSKAAVISLCESLQTELAGGVIKFQVINPGFVKSSLTDKNDFKMPYLMQPADAAREIYKGLQTNRFEIAFPAPFVRQMRFLKWMPDRFYFPLIRKVAKL